MNNDYMGNIIKAREGIAEALTEIKPLCDHLQGEDQRRLLVAVSQLVSASLALGFRKPAVPCRLDFISKHEVVEHF